MVANTLAFRHKEKKVYLKWLQTLAFHDKEKSLMENGCEHSSFLQHGKKVLWKIYAKTPAFHDKE